MGLLQEGQNRERSAVMPVVHSKQEAPEGAAAPESEKCLATHGIWV